MATSRRSPRPPLGTSGRRSAAPPNDPPPATDAHPADHAESAARGNEPVRLTPVRLAPREELAAAARVAPLLRAATEVARWAANGPAVGPDGALTAAKAAAAAGELELTPEEFRAAWRVAAGAGMLRVAESAAQPGERLDVLADGTADEVLAAWGGALARMLAAEDRDALATALYTVGGPVKMEALFDAYMTAAGAGEQERGEAAAAEVSAALEELADLGVVELGTDEPAGGLTVTLSPLGVWGVHRHLRDQGWHVPVLGNARRADARALLTTLAGCDLEDGEAEISSWLAARTPAQAAAELIAAAREGTPGLRGASFAVMDRIGADAVPEVRNALGDPLVGAHAAVWLHEHGEEGELSPEQRAWLLVDLGAGLLEEADPRDVVVELLPDLPGEAQAELVARLWRVDHPALADLLTTLSDHHPDPGVSRAARKAAFKARSPAGPLRRRRSGPIRSID